MAENEKPVEESGDVFEIAKRELYEALDEYLEELPGPVAYAWGQFNGVMAVFADMEDDFEEDEESEEEPK